jgi:hypothetical protein
LSHPISFIREIKKANLKRIMEEERVSPADLSSDEMDQTDETDQGAVQQPRYSCFSPGIEVPSNKSQK